MKRAVVRMALFTLATAAARAQGTRQVSVTITAVSGRSLYLDRGRNDGLAPGGRVRLFPTGAGQLEVEVRAVSASSSRAELEPGQTPPPVGTRGEADVAATVPGRDAARPDRARLPEHPPWSRQEPARAEGQPLLVPSFRQHPAERPLDVHGRWFAQGDFSSDGTGEADSEYLLARTGTWLEGRNVAGLAERLRFAGEIGLRRANLPQGPDTSDATARLDLASAAFGTEDWAPFGVEVGRFSSEHLPELGLVDGVEGVARWQGGLRAGVGVGSYPRPFPARDTGEDLGAHVFADFVADAERTVAASLAFQKTWHEGAPDRDLFLLRAEGRPARGLWLHSTARVDVYSGSDARKRSAVELTEFQGHARLDGEVAGVGVQVSRFLWPDLKRREYQDLPDELVRDGRLERLSLSGWLRPWTNLRVSARGDAWRDRSHDGIAWDASVDWTEVLGERSSLHAAVFHTDGSHSAGPGLRLRARKDIGGVDASLAWRWHRYDIEGFLDGTETLTRQSLALGLDGVMGAADWSLAAERWFGDREDAYALSLFTQYRF